MKTVNKSGMLFLALSVFSFSCLSTFAQTKTSPKKENPVSVSSHLVVFEQAKTLGDIGTAISSLNYLIATEPQKYQTYADTLASVYLNAGFYTQCNNLTSYLLMRSPNKESLLSMKALSLRQMNQAVEATDLYNKLYSQTQNYRYGLELMQLQLSLQRLPECLLTTNQVLTLSIKETDKVSVPTKDGKATQDVNVKSFVQYIQGLAYNASKEKEKAISLMEKAFEGDKKFELAEAAIIALKTPIEAPKLEEVKK